MSFTTSCGWLEYRPFRTYELPTHCHVEDDNGEVVKARFVDKRDPDSVRFTRKLYRLCWPGEQFSRGIRDAAVPASVVEKWPKFKSDPKCSQSHHTIQEILDGDWLDDEPPYLVAYHIAINYKLYGLDKVPFPVAGLPASYVQKVVDARFAFDEDAVPALTYLKFLAEGHRGHPLLINFDTMIRDGLMSVGQDAAYRFFWLAGDYLYDAERQWWAEHNESRRLWHRVACYLHWVGRTGTGLYVHHSRLAERSGPKLDEAPELRDRLASWFERQHKSRAKSHVTGKDPCVGEGEEAVVVKKPVKKLRGDGFNEMAQKQAALAKKDDAQGDGE